MGGSAQFIPSGRQVLEKRFSTLLLKWNRERNSRKMPWKGEKDPYKIWLSEIILQQTRVEQGLDYYNKFTHEYPNIHQLAQATDDQVYKLWEGLGYYTRCRNLLFTARYISKELGGKFPDNYLAIKALKGIGPYTAAAISSFAFNLPHAVVDGNVFRVLARIFNISVPVDTTQGKKIFTELAEKLLDKKSPAHYNQAIMDFGAVICKPVNPDCKQCVFNKDCYAFLNGVVDQLPVKEKKIRIKTRWFYYLVLEYKNQVYIRQRQGKDIWQQLFEFPLMESDNELEEERIFELAEKNRLLGKAKYNVLALSPFFKQQLSHQLIRARFINIQVNAPVNIAEGGQWVGKNDLKRFAFPRIVNQYLQQPS